MSRTIHIDTTSVWNASFSVSQSDYHSTSEFTTPQTAVIGSEHVADDTLSAENHEGLAPHICIMLAYASHQLKFHHQAVYDKNNDLMKLKHSTTSYVNPRRSQTRHQRHLPTQARLQLEFHQPNHSRVASFPAHESHRLQRHSGVQVCNPAPSKDARRGPPPNGSVILYCPKPPSPAGPGYSAYRAPRTRYGDQQSDPPRRIQMQTDFLDSLALDIPPLNSAQFLLKRKEAFRVRLTEIARKALARYAESHELCMGPNAIDFKCFGSLRNGFALPGADMDLKMITRAPSFPTEINPECPYILEKAFLDAGLGARLISKAGLPVVKLCEVPSQTFLAALRRERKFREENDCTIVTQNRQTRVRPVHRLNATSIIRDCNSRGSVVSVQFPTSGVGIKCDIDFSGRLAIYNSELLRCYSLCDDRVRLVGLFVKRWAKARRINDPNYGTLCSYGYILMVLHYLTNVVNPPVTPNLQIIYRPAPRSCSEKVANVDGCDIQFFSDEPQIRAQAKANAWNNNHQSLGDLLRGFFAYYAYYPGRRREAPLGGFDWVNSVVSIRTRGGILTKAEKEWTATKVDPSGVRHKHLLAIEDPFQKDHNVGRTVSQPGVSTIRKEFFRAYTIINRVQEIPGVGWEWRTDGGSVGEDFFAEPEDVPSLRHASSD